MRTVWTITYIDENNEPQIMIFDNPLVANACYRHFYNIYRSGVWIDECEVYGSFMVAGNKE